MKTDNPSTAATRAVGATAPPDVPLGADLIWGVAAIAAEIDRTKRQTNHMIETGKLPVGRMGGRIVASRAKLREHFDALIKREV